jgi:hypothetical protein
MEAMSTLRLAHSFKMLQHVKTLSVVLGKIAIHTIATPELAPSAQKTQPIPMSAPAG